MTTEDPEEANPYIEEREPSRWPKGVGILLLLLALIVTLFTAGKVINLLRPNLEGYRIAQEKKDVASLQGEILHVLESYGLREQWIVKKTHVFQGSEFIRQEWLVPVPPDLPLATLQLDLDDLVSRNDGRVYAVENAKTQQLFMHVKFGPRINQTIVLTPRGNLSRSGGVIALIVDDISEASEGDLTAYRDLRDPIACIIEPSRNILQTYEQIKLSGKEILLHIHFHAQRVVENRFAVSEDMTSEQVKGKLRLIVKTFPSARFAMVTTEDAVGTNEALARSELSRNGLTMIQPASLTYLDRSTAENNLVTRMNDIAALADQEAFSIGVVRCTESNIRFYVEQMQRLRKRGYQFIPLRRLDIKEKG